MLWFSGTEEVSVVIEKIVNSQRLGEGLMEQCKDYEVIGNPGIHVTHV
jgi:hypothetical protein